MNPKHYEGKPCVKCRSTVRYRTDGRCVACQLARCPNHDRAKRRVTERAWLRRNRHKVAEKHRKRRGLPAPTRPTPEVCECCGRLPGNRILALDHCHETSRFRGWLCNACNLGIGQLGDTAAGVQRAIKYLQENG